MKFPREWSLFLPRPSGSRPPPGIRAQVGRLRLRGLPAFLGEKLFINGLEADGSVGLYQTGMSVKPSYRGQSLIVVGRGKWVRDSFFRGKDGVGFDRNSLRVIKNFSSFMDLSNKEGGANINESFDL